MMHSSSLATSLISLCCGLRKFLMFLPVAMCISFVSCTEGEQPSDDPQAVFQSLWRNIDEHYCFLDYKKEELGVDWNDIYAKYQPRLNPTMTQLQLFEVLCDMLSELRDGHVNLYCSADVGRNWSWHEDYPENLSTELRDRYLGTDYRIAAGLKYRILEDNVGYVVYESFTHGIGEGNIADVLYFLRTCTGLILDVRSNTGGQLNYAEMLSSHFTNERILVGYTAHKAGPGHNDFSTPQPQYLNPSTTIRWQKPCIVLTNRSCYSATNEFVRNMKECPQVTILGDQTGGGSGMPFTSVLPNGWTLRYSACPMYDARMEHTEFGILPDIPCALDSTDMAKGKDTLIERARKEITKAVEKEGNNRVTQATQQKLHP